MCLISFKFVKDKLFIGANREEVKDRPFTEPEFIKTEKNKSNYWLAGKDFGLNNQYKDFGSWLGFNEDGVSVALTNLHDWRKHQVNKGVYPRGLFLRKLLEIKDYNSTVKFCRSFIEKNDNTKLRMGPVNFVIAKYDCITFISYPTPFVSLEVKTSGLGVITNQNLNDYRDHRINYCIGNLKNKTLTLNWMFKILSSRAIYNSDPDQTTLSSTVLAIAEDEIDMYHSSHAPSCENDYKKITTLSTKRKSDEC